MNKELIAEAFRNCITEPKCRDCPWKTCEMFDQPKTRIPLDLALAVNSMLIDSLKEREVVLCKDCKHKDYCFLSRNKGDDFYCGNGEIETGQSF